MNLWILISFGYIYKKDKLTRMFSTECCRELTIESGSSGAESQFAGFHGHYEFKFKKANLVQIEEGFFVYKKTRKAKYLFKSQDGIWMVRYLNYLLICRCYHDITYHESIYNVRFKYYTLDWFQTKWYC